MAKGYSLHIGLNSVDPAHYDGWSGELTACEADAASMKKICASKGFVTEVLLTRHATRTALLSKLSAYAEALQAGDTLIISYSGHGGQLPDGNGDESDGLDETWCMFDGEVLDDELYRAWDAFRPGVRIVLFSDSCHSGTVSRQPSLAVQPVRSVADVGRQVAFRVMPPEIAFRTYEANRKFYDDLLAAKAPPPDPACTVILISGCQDNQLSSDGTFNGAFTGALVRTWGGGAFRGTYKQFKAAILKKLPSTQSPNYYVVGAPNSAFENADVFSI